MAGYSATHELPQRSQAGGRKVVIYSAFQASDGPLLIAASNNRLFAKLAKALGRAEWADDPRFRNNAGRFSRSPISRSEENTPKRRSWARIKLLMRTRSRTLS